MLEARSPVTLRKSVKNEAELAGMREAHLRDAVAIVQFLQWLDDQVCTGHLHAHVCHLACPYHLSATAMPTAQHLWGCVRIQKELTHLDHTSITLLICTIFACESRSRGAGAGMMSYALLPNPCLSEHSLRTHPGL